MTTSCRSRVRALWLAAACLLTAVLVACGSNVVTGGGGHAQDAGTGAAGATGGAGVGGWNPEPDAGAGGAGGQGGQDDWCKPTVNGHLSGDMISTCCDGKPCWGHCIAGPIVAQESRLFV